MTLATLRNRKRLWLCGVKCRITYWQIRGPGLLGRGADERPGKQQNSGNQNHNVECGHIFPSLFVAHLIYSPSRNLLFTLFIVFYFFSAFLLFFREIVQVVGNIVATAADREFIVNPLRVWQAMAIAAIRYRLMLVGVTGDAGNVMMLGFGRLQHLINVIMTSGAENVRRTVRIGDRQRLVGLVAVAAVRLGNVLRM